MQGTNSMHRRTALGFMPVNAEQMCPTTAAEKCNPQSLGPSCTTALNHPPPASPPWNHFSATPVTCHHLPASHGKL